MNRRTKERVDLTLQCRLGPEKVLSVPSAGSRVIGQTSNLSRSGMLIHWLDSVEAPLVGSDLTVDIDLPADALFGPRMMRCRTSVVRIIRQTEGPPTIGLKIRNIRFVQPGADSDQLPDSRAVSSKAGPKPAAAAGNKNGKWELESMPPASERLN